MSEFHVQVFRIGKVGKHPKADTLSITQGPNGYPVVFKTGEFCSGELAVHVPVDAVVDTDLPEFAWLADKAIPGPDGRWLHRVKACKLRGIPSYGLLVPVPEGVEWTAGQDVRGQLSVTKYEPGPCFSQDGTVHGNMVSLPEEGMVPIYDIEGMRKYGNVIKPGEVVSVTEKIHGSNGRWVHLAGTLLCGSRNKFRTASVWNRIADIYNLGELLSLPENRGLVLYGEVYGPGIQDLTYGVSEPEAIFFDLYDTKTGLWHSPDQFMDWCERHGLPHVPELYRGPYNAPEIAAMAEGSSTLPGAEHVREGVVVKPLVERWDQEIGRVFLKQPGEGYLLRHELKKDIQDLCEAAAQADSGPATPHSAWARLRAFLGI